LVVPLPALPGSNVACQFRNEIEANYIGKCRRCEKIQKKFLLQSHGSQRLHCNHTLTFGLLSGLFVNTNSAAIFCRKFSRPLASMIPRDCARLRSHWPGTCAVALPWSARRTRAASQPPRGDFFLLAFPNLIPLMAYIGSRTRPRFIRPSSTPRTPDERISPSFVAVSPFVYPAIVKSAERF
jgi:hypothetical protein